MLRPALLALVDRSFCSHDAFMILLLFMILSLTIFCWIHLLVDVVIANFHGVSPLQLWISPELLRLVLPLCLQYTFSAP